MELGRPPVSTSTFWEELYAEGKDGWELGTPAPALTAWLDSGGRFTGRDATGPARIAVPGAGRGHDARLLARRGYRVWGFDFAAAAIALATALAQEEGVAVRYERRDIFTLGAEYAGFFDSVWEYTCFCAIDPGRREEYARVIHAILRPGGTLLGCFYPLRDGEDGPPFPVSQPEIERILAPRFRIIESGPPASSAERRQGARVARPRRAARVTAVPPSGAVSLSVINRERCRESRWPGSGRHRFRSRPVRAGWNREHGKHGRPSHRGATRGAGCSSRPARPVSILGH